MLAEKISGTHVGLWLLIPEHLRLGTWDLLKAWTGIPLSGMQMPLNRDWLYKWFTNLRSV